MLKKKIKEFLREWALPFLIVLSVLAPIRSVIADYNYIPSGSMTPTLLVGDNVLVNKLAYDLKIPFSTWHISEWGAPKRGEVVVFFSPVDKMRLVKRVIGVPGDMVELRDNRLIINGNPISYRTAQPDNALSESEKKLCNFSSEKLTDTWHDIMEIPMRESVKNFGPVMVPAGKYFMMGDSRDNSNDSRFLGFIDRSEVVGRVEAVIWSKPMWQLCLPVFDRFFRGVS